MCLDDSEMVEGGPADLVAARQTSRLGPPADRLLLGMPLHLAVDRCLAVGRAGEVVAAAP